MLPTALVALDGSLQREISCPLVIALSSIPLFPLFLLFLLFFFLLSFLILSFLFYLLCFLLFYILSYSSFGGFTSCVSVVITVFVDDGGGVVANTFDSELVGRVRSRNFIILCFM